MTHNKDCKCINCQAKGKPIREIWLRSVTAEELTEIEVCDWLEGFGMIDSLAMQKYVRKYGFLIIKEREEVYNKTTNHYNNLINRLNEEAQVRDDQIQCQDKEIRVQSNRLRANLGILDHKNEEIQKAEELAESYRIAYEKRQLTNLTTFLLDNLIGKTDYPMIKADREKCFELLNNFQPFYYQGQSLSDQLKRLLELIQFHKDNLSAALESRDADWGRIKDLEIETKSYSERVHSLEEENGRYFEQICRLETVIDKLIRQLPDKNPEQTPAKNLEIENGALKHQIRRQANSIEHYKQEVDLAKQKWNRAITRLTHLIDLAETPRGAIAMISKYLEEEDK